MSDVFCTINNLSVSYSRNNKESNAITNLNLVIKEGEILGLVGESGCGKTTLGKVLMGLKSIQKGNIELNIKEKNTIKNNVYENKCTLENNNIQMIFQNPSSSLDNTMDIYHILEEPLIYMKDNEKNRFLTKKERINRIEELMVEVGLDLNYLRQKSSKLSGGQKQRVCIARAIACRPRFLICDEPVSALDVSLQAGILNLLKQINDKYNTTILFISHDIGVVNYLCHRVAVMLKGRLCEIGDRKNILFSPKHPYTKFLLSSIPSNEKIGFTKNEDFKEI